jgi:hypothetical protein
VTVDLSGAGWFKSSYSATQSDCVEVAFLDGEMVGIRDSKDAAGAALIVSGSAWEAFVAEYAAGRPVN